MNKFLEKLKHEIRRKRYSYQTEKAYLGWVKRYLIYLHRNSLKGNYEYKITTFLNYLTQERNVSASTQNQALCAIVFFYEQVLNKPVGTLQNLEFASVRKNLPVVLSEKEVTVILNHLSGVKKLIVSLIYGSGLRISECLRLRILDLDLDYHQIEIRNSKGNRDRYSIIPDKLIQPIKEQILKVKRLHQQDLAKGYGRTLLPGALHVKYPGAPEELKWQYLFPSVKIGRDPRTGFFHRYHQSAQAVNREIKSVVKKTNMQKKSVISHVSPLFCYPLTKKRI